MIVRIKNTFSERKDEIDRYFKLLENIEKGAFLAFVKDDETTELESIDVTLSSTLKSGAILLLYNAIEATISDCLKTIHDAFTDEELTYADLSDDIQKIWLKHYYNTVNILNQNDKNINELKIIVEVLSMNQTVALTYDTLTKLKTGSQFSGNLDADAIRKIATRYGVPFDKRSEQVRVVRDRRNKLAHGEQTFQECCRELDMRYMNILKTETVKFIDAFIDSVDFFIRNKQYRKNV